GPAPLSFSLSLSFPFLSFPRRGGPHPSGLSLRRWVLLPSADATPRTPPGPPPPKPSPLPTSTPAPHPATSPASAPSRSTHRLRSPPPVLASAGVLSRDLTLSFSLRACGVGRAATGGRPYDSLPPFLCALCAHCGSMP